MQVHCDEGVANRIGPEPCAGVREGTGEASAGECIGQPLSRERIINVGADRVEDLEGNTDGHAKRVPGRPTEVADPGMCIRSLYGNREISRLAIRQSPVMVRIGKARSRSR